MNTKFVFLVLVSLAALGIGCGAGEDAAGESQDSIAAPAASQTFRLFTPEGEEPGPQDSCGPATFTSLKLSETVNGFEGTFNEGTPFPTKEPAASSDIEWPFPCKAVFVVKDYFEYRLTRQPGACGATIYVSTKSSPDGASIKITDHRESTCHEFPAALEIEETHDGKTTKLVGRDL